MSKFVKAAISGVRWNSLGTIVRTIIQTIQIAILARILPVEVFGLLALSLFVINLTNMIVEMGFTSAVLHHQDVTKEEYNSLFWFNLFIAFISYTIVFLLSPWIATFYNSLEMLVVLPMLSLNIIILSWGKLHYTILQKHLKFKALSLIEIIGSFVALLLSVGLAYNNYGVMSVVYATLASSFLISVASIRVCDLKFVGLSFRFNELKRFYSIGLYSFGSKIVSIFSTDIDILIIGKTLGSEALGIYSLSKQLVLKLFLLLSPILSNVLTPLLSTIQSETALLKHYYQKVISIISNISTPFYLIMAFISYDVLRILYGENFTSGDKVVMYLSIAYLVNSTANPIGSLQVATGRTDIGFRWALVSLIVTPLVIYISSLFSIEIVALSRSILSLVMIYPFWLVQIKPMLNISLHEYVYSFYRQILFIIAAVVITQLGLFDVCSNLPGVIIMIIKITSIMIAYAIYTLLFNRTSTKMTYVSLKKLFV